MPAKTPKSTKKPPAKKATVSKAKRQAAASEKKAANGKTRPVKNGKAKEPPGLPPTYASGRRIARLTRMLLQNPHGEREDKLAELLGVSHKGIERYLGAIALEFPGELIRNGTGSDRVARIRKEQDVSQLGMFPFAAAFFAGQFLNWVNGSKLADDHANALKRLEIRVNSRGDMPLDTLANKFRFFARAPKDLRLHRNTLDTIVDALLGEWELNITYTDAKGQPKHYPRFQPLTLAAFQEALYLVGQKHKGKHRFHLAVERIRDIERLQTHFTYPRDFDPDDLRKDAFGMFQGDPMQIALRFDKHLIPAIQTRRWHATQKFRKETDGRLVLSFRASGDADLVSWILSFGPGVEVLEPASLRERVAEELASAAALYVT